MQAEHSITIKIAQGQASIRTLAQLKKELTASDAQADNLEEAIKDVDRALDGMSREAISSARSVDRLTKENKQLERQLERVDRSSTRTFGTMAGLLGGISFVFLAQQLKHVSDEISGLESRIADVTKTSGDYNQVLEQVIESADSAGVKLNTTATLFTRLSMGRDELGATNEQIITLGETVQKLGVLSGATQQELDGALLQFSQSMSSGIVQGQEFNSIMEQAPAIFIEVAKQMNTTTGALRSTMLAGDLLAKDVFDALMKSTDDVNQRFKDMGDFAYQAENRLSNAFKLAVKSVDDAVGATQAYIDALQYTRDILREITDEDVRGFLEGVHAALQIGAGILVARYIPSVIAAALKAKAFTVAQIQASAAMVAGSQAATGLSARMGMASNAMTIATTRQIALTTALRAGAGALALMGGPAGVAIIAATAFFALRKSTVDVEDSMRRLKEETMSYRGELVGLGETELKQHIARQKAAAEMANFRLLELQHEKAMLVANRQRAQHVRVQNKNEEIQIQAEQYKSLAEKVKMAENALASYYESMASSANTNTNTNTNTKTPDVQAPRYDNLNMLDQLREYHMGELEQINKHHQDRVNAALALNLSEQQIAQAGFESRAALNDEIIKLSEQRRDKELELLGEAAGEEFTAGERRLQQQREQMERGRQDMLNSFALRRADQLEAEGRIEEAGRLRLEAELEQVNAFYVREQDQLRLHLENKLLTEDEFANRKAELVLLREQDLADKRNAIEEALERQRLARLSSQVGVMGDFYGNLAQLAGKNSREQRALMIAQSTMAAIQTGINTRNTATAAGLPEPGPAILGGIAFAAQMAQVQQLKSQSVGAYEQGGFIPGTSYRGDNLVANVNSGEAVLNAGQQREFMRLANGGGATNSAPVFNFYGLPAQPKVTRNEQGGYDFDFTDAFRDMLDSPEGDRVFTSAVRKVS